MNSIKTISLLVGMSIAFAAFAQEGHEHAQPAAAAQVDAQGNRTFGQPMPDGPAIGIVEAVDFAPGRFGRGQHKISGRIAKVCQSEGCWMVLADGETSARVMFADHAFVIPTDSTGTAEVYGTLSVKVIDEATAKHLAADAGQDPAKVVGESKEVRISATSVVIKAS
jgi:hypothetical protein